MESIPPDIQVQVHLSSNGCSLLLCLLRTGAPSSFSAEGAGGIIPLRQMHSRSQGSLHSPGLLSSPFFSSLVPLCLVWSEWPAAPSFLVMTQLMSAGALEEAFKGTNTKVLIGPRNSQAGTSEPKELGVKGTWITSALPSEEAVTIIAGNNNIDNHNKCW